MTEGSRPWIDANQYVLMCRDLYSTVLSKGNFKKWNTSREHEQITNYNIKLN